MTWLIRVSTSADQHSKVEKKQRPLRIDWHLDEFQEMTTMALPVTDITMSTSEQVISVMKGMTSSKMIILSRLSSSRSRHAKAFSFVCKKHNNHAGIRHLSIDQRHLLLPCIRYFTSNYMNRLFMNRHSSPWESRDMIGQNSYVLKTLAMKQVSKHLHVC